MLAKIVKEDQRNWDLYIPSKYLAYGLVGNFVCLMTCFNHTPAFPNISFILSTIPSSSQGWRALSRLLAKLWSQGIASHSKGLLWPLENQHLSSRRPSPLVGQENPEGQVYETGKVEWSDLQDQVGSYSSVKTRVVNFNQLKSLNRACNKDQGWTAVERGPTGVLRRFSTQAGSDARRHFPGNYRRSTFDTASSHSRRSC